MTERRGNPQDGRHAGDYRCGVARSPRALLLAVLLAVLAMPAHAAIEAAARQEIDTLLARLAASACEFERNGSWHSAADARTHLLRKRDAVARRTTIASSEQFIELAASASSTSGRPYRVRCGAAGPVESRRWLFDELQRLRRPEAGSQGR